MPKLTNILSLPDPLVRAVAFSTYNKGDADFSVTELVSPPRIAALTRLHADEIEEDASDRLWLLMGSAGHEALRRSAVGGLVEQRADIELDGCKISGQVDYAVFDDVLWDFKLTSLYAVKDGPKPEWISQGNSYRYILNKYGVPIKSIKICAIFRDWSLPESMRSTGDYPKHQVQVLEIPLWEFDDTEQWLLLRIALHRAARAGTLPLCTPEEVWEKPAKFAVRKHGAQRALKLHDNQKDAELHAMSSPGLEVEVRPAERPRCQMYCQAAPFCAQYAAWRLENRP